MSKQFIGGLIVGAIAGSYVMYNYLYKCVTKIALDHTSDENEDKEKTTEE